MKHYEIRSIEIDTKERAFKFVARIAFGLSCISMIVLSIVVPIVNRNVRLLIDKIAAEGDLCELYVDELQNQLDRFQRYLIIFCRRKYVYNV